VQFVKNASVEKQSLRLQSQMWSV